MLTCLNYTFYIRDSKDCDIGFDERRRSSSRFCSAKILEVKGKVGLSVRYSVQNRRAFLEPAIKMAFSEQ